MDAVIRFFKALIWGVRVALSIALTLLIAMVAFAAMGLTLAVAIGNSYDPTTGYPGASGAENLLALGAIWCPTSAMVLVSALLAWIIAPTLKPTDASQEANTPT